MATRRWLAVVTLATKPGLCGSLRVRVMSGPSRSSLAQENRGFGTRPASLLLSYPNVENGRAVRCYEKSGFRKLKRLPRHELHEGVQKDCCLMEVTPDWFPDCQPAPSQGICKPKGTHAPLYPLFFRNDSLYIIHGHLFGRFGRYTCHHRTSRPLTSPKKRST